VLSNGSLSSAAKISASRFSKAAEEKIERSGGEAIRI
jgi:ribosomal protein L18E